jgi:DNA replication protein DnaC
LTAALLDRLTHHAHIIELTGVSYRFRQRMQEKEWVYRFGGLPAG